MPRKSAAPAPASSESTASTTSAGPSGAAVADPAEPPPPADTAALPGTRERLIAAMLDALRRRGYHGVGLAELLSAAGAPKGVLYHHFPGGKTELAVAAIRSAIDGILAGLDRVMDTPGDPLQALAAWMHGAQKVLLGSGFERGCPLATIGLESTPQDQAIRAAVAEGFAAIRERVSQVFERAGVPPVQAHAVATLVLSAYEGALLQSRVSQQVEPVRDTSAALVALIRPLLAARPEAGGAHAAHPSPTEMTHRKA